MTDKMGIMDIKAVINNNVQCDIEMQVVSQDDIAERILFYMSSEYKKSLKQGDTYGDVRKTIAVLVADFELKNITEVPKYATKWNFREEDYPEVILTDAMEIYIIELPKLTQYANNTNKERLNLWVEFIKNPGVKIIINDEDDKETIETKETIQEALERYEQLQEDKHEMELAELRLKYILDQNSIKKTGYREGMEKGIEKGRKEGIKEGIREGKKEQIREMVINLIKKGMDNKFIIEMTQVSEEEIESIRKSENL